MNDIEARLFVRRDRIKNTAYGLSLLLLASACALLWRQQAERPVQPLIPMDDQQYIATSKQFVELLYSLNAATIIEDGHLLLRMIHPDQTERKNAHLQYLIEQDIVRKTQAAGLRSRIDWTQSDVRILNRAQGARVIECQGRYEYKTPDMDRYEHKSFEIAVSLMQDQTGTSPYGVWVYDWENHKL